MCFLLYLEDCGCLILTSFLSCNVPFPVSSYNSVFLTTHTLLFHLAHVRVPVSRLGALIHWGEWVSLMGLLDTLLACVSLWRLGTSVHLPLAYGQCRQESGRELGSVSYVWSLLWHLVLHCLLSPQNVFSFCQRWSVLEWISSSWVLLNKWCSFRKVGIRRWFCHFFW